MKKIFALMALALPLIFSSCVKDEMYKGPSTIKNVKTDIEAPTSNDDVTVTVTVEGLQNIASAVINYDAGGKKASSEMSGSGKTFSGKIPAQPDKTKVSYTVTVVNEAGFETTSDKKEYTVGNPPMDYTKLVLNELYGAGADNEKFIELYNNSDFAISLMGVTIRKDEELTWTGLENESVPAHGWFAIIGAKGTTERGISSGFSAKKSVLIELVDPNGNIVDKFQRGDKGTGWGSQGLDNNSGSWSRVPDGAGPWAITNTTTAGQKNASKDADATDVK